MPQTRENSLPHFRKNKALPHLLVLSMENQGEMGYNRHIMLTFKRGDNNVCYSP